LKYNFIYTQKLRKAGSILFLNTFILNCIDNEMPVMECPNCNTDFYYSGETKTEKGSYWIDEDEPSPF
jgi:hypothetical protein